MGEWDEASVEMVRAAAERGVCQAEAIYAQMLLDGKLVTQNASLALHFFERAARGGHVMAMNMVGRCLDQGWGVAKSPHLAAPWFRAAAERGLDWGMYNLVTLLALGSGLPEDKGEAFRWLRKAAELDHAKSLNLLGGFYEDGWAVATNLQTARKLYYAAAVRGDFRGQFNLARMLASEGDPDTALQWLRRVPETATRAFLVKMRQFLEQWPSPEVRSFAATLPMERAEAA